MMYQPTAAELSGELQQLESGHAQIIGIETKDNDRFVRLQYLRLNQVIEMVADHFFAAWELKSRVVIRTVHSGRNGAPSFAEELLTLDSLGAFLPPEFCKVSNTGFTPRTQLKLSFGHCVSASPGRLWSSASRADESFFEDCLKLNFATNGSVKAVASWMNGEQVYGEAHPEPSPPTGWRMMGIHVEPSTATESSSGDDEPFEAVREVVRKPVNGGAQVTENAPSAKKTRRSTWDSQCDTLLNRWIAHMEETDEWIDKVPFFNSVLPEYQQRSPGKWKPEWTADRFKRKFNSHPDKWKSRVSEWDPG